MQHLKSTINYPKEPILFRICNTWKHNKIPKRTRELCTHLAKLSFLKMYALRKPVCHERILSVSQKKHAQIIRADCLGFPDLVLLLQYEITMQKKTITKGDALATRIRIMNAPQRNYIITNTIVGYLRFRCTKPTSKPECWAPRTE
jgi:hypothetical protein